jgi:hypothetical protein
MPALLKCLTKNYSYALSQALSPGLEVLATQNELLRYRICLITLHVTLIELLRGNSTSITFQTSVGRHSALGNFGSDDRFQWALGSNTVHAMFT